MYLVIFFELDCEMFIVVNIFIVDWCGWVVGLEMLKLIFYVYEICGGLNVIFLFVVGMG